jgi:hypothetical protein
MKKILALRYLGLPACRRHRCRLDGSFAARDGVSNHHLLADQRTGDFR